MSATGKQQVPGHHQPGAGEGFLGLAHHLGASGRETTPAVLLGSLSQSTTSNPRA